jgi:bifunctional non-homologous end joining protein LigD
MAFLYAFDLLELNGQDLRREPLEVRKATLASILRMARHGVRLNVHLEHDCGLTVFQHACKMGLEGIVSKRLGSTYRSGRSPTGSSSRTRKHRRLSGRLRRSEDDDYPATALMCGKTEWSK